MSDDSILRRRRYCSLSNESLVSKLSRASEIGSRWNVETPSKSPDYPVRRVTKMAVRDVDPTWYTSNQEIPSIARTRFRKNVFGKVPTNETASLSEYVESAVRISSGLSSKQILKKDSKSQNRSGRILGDRTASSRSLDLEKKCHEMKINF
jgi:hypothetical protein